MQNHLAFAKVSGHSGAWGPHIRTTWALGSGDQNVQVLLGVGVLT